MLPMDPPSQPHTTAQRTCRCSHSSWVGCRVSRTGRTMCKGAVRGPSQARQGGKQLLAIWGLVAVGTAPTSLQWFSSVSSRYSMTFGLSLASKSRAPATGCHLCHTQLWAGQPRTSCTRACARACCKRRAWNAACVLPYRVRQWPPLPPHKGLLLQKGLLQQHPRNTASLPFPHPPPLLLLQQHLHSHSHSSRTPTASAPAPHTPTALPSHSHCTHLTPPLQQHLHSHLYSPHPPRM